MQRIVPEASTSWLSLIAETAGAAGATIARVKLGMSQTGTGMCRVFVQVVDPRGQVLGATSWYGDKRQLDAGVQLDLGCDLSAALGATLIGWVKEGVAGASSSPASEEEINPRQAVAPFCVARCDYDPYRPMVLDLSRNNSSLAASINKQKATGTLSLVSHSAQPPY